MALSTVGPTLDLIRILGSGVWRRRRRAAARVCRYKESSALFPISVGRDNLLSLGTERAARHFRLISSKVVTGWGAVR